MWVILLKNSTFLRFQSKINPKSLHLAQIWLCELFHFWWQPALSPLCEPQIKHVTPTFNKENLKTTSHRKLLYKARNFLSISQSYISMAKLPNTNWRLDCLVRVSSQCLKNVFARQNQLATILLWNVTKGWRVVAVEEWLWSNMFHWKIETCWKFPTGRTHNWPTFALLKSLWENNVAFEEEKRENYPTIERLCYIEEEKMKIIQQLVKFCSSQEPLRGWGSFRK